jgi:glycosyltransferase involved in cell wall biosynthesis
MIREPSVSVLVPCYNKQEYLEETLKSVYTQTYQDWELIVVDDGSTDGSQLILHRHENRLRAILQASQGASAARQRALGAARGRYIQYLDADDLLLPNALADRVAALEGTDADVAYSDWQKLRPNPGGFVRAEVVARRIDDVNPDPEIACFTSFWCPPAALLYKRGIVERIGPWNASLPVIQDARYLLDAALAGGRFVHVPGVSALYRDDASNSLSRRSGRAFVADVFRNAEQVTRVWESRGQLTDLQKRALAGCYGYVARQAFRHDARVFDDCVVRLRELDRSERRSWPYVAATVQRALGHRTALAVLRLLGRPAP